MAKVMLTVNMDIKDHLIISQTGYVRHIKFAQGSVGKIKVKFSDKQAGLKAMKSSYLDRQNSKVPTEKCETENSKKRGSPSPSIKQTQFPLTLALASTIHKFQGLSSEGVIDLYLWKQKPFGPGQICTVFCQVKTHDNLFCIGSFK